jgi:hypothetical protein
MPSNVFNFQYGPVSKFLNGWGVRTTNKEGRDMVFQIGGELPELVLVSIAVQITKKDLFPRDYPGELILPVASQFPGQPATVVFNTLELMSVFKTLTPGEDGWVEATIDMHAGKSTGTITIGKRSFPCEVSEPLPPVRLSGYNEKYGVEFDVKKKLLAFLVPDKGLRVVIRTQSDLCRTCQGDGTVNETPCPKCQGTGKSGEPAFQIGEYVVLRKMFQPEFELAETDPTEVYAVETKEKEPGVSKRKARAAAAAAMVENGTAEPVVSEVPPVAVIGAGAPPLTVPPEEACLACGGKGVSTKGGPCVPCAGTGKRPSLKPVEAFAEAPASATVTNSATVVLVEPASKPDVSAAPALVLVPPTTVPSVVIPPPAITEIGAPQTAAAEAEAAKAESTRKRRSSDEVRIEKLEAAKALLREDGWKVEPVEETTDDPDKRLTFHLQKAVGSLQSALDAVEARKKQPPKPVGAVMPKIGEEQARTLKAIPSLVPSLQPLVEWILSQPRE